MHRFFEPLEEREAMLLLTTLTVGGADDLSVLGHLPQETAARIKQKADALLAIESDKRVPFMVREIKAALSPHSSRGLDRIDPSWILSRLKGESPQTVALILTSLPSATVRTILKRLPRAIRKALPGKAEVAELPQELQQTARMTFEQRFAPMPRQTPGGFAFNDIHQLDRSDIYKLLRDLGLTELGQAFVAMGKRALAELCRRLPDDNAQELIAAVRSASQVDVPEKKTAQRFLSRIAVNFSDTDEFFQRAGLWRLAKGALLEEEDVRAAVRQRLTKDAGATFDAFVEKAQEMTDLSEAALYRLRDSVLHRIVELSKQGTLNGRWQDETMLYHDPNAVPAGPQEPQE